jgi:tRNA (cmo5U34)-methyltransferase
VSDQERHDNGESDEQSAAERARSYDEDIRAAMPGYDVLHETVAALLKNELSDEARILAVGVGTGEEIARLAPGNPGWRLTAVDPSAEMLAVARERVEGSGLGDRVDFHVGYAHDLPAGQAYDAATLILVQHFLPDDGAKLDLLRSIATRLKPGSPLILANMHGDLRDPVTQRLYQAWKRRQIARGMSASDADAMFQGLPQVVHFVSSERIRELLSEAGFGDVEPVFNAFVIGGWLARKTAGG